MVAVGSRHGLDCKLDYSTSVHSDSISFIYVCVLGQAIKTRRRPLCSHGHVLKVVPELDGFFGPLRIPALELLPDPLGVESDEIRRGAFDDSHFDPEDLVVGICDLLLVVAGARWVVLSVLPQQLVPEDVGDVGELGVYIGVIEIQQNRFDLDREVSAVDASVSTS